MDTEQAKTLIQQLANQGCIGFSNHCSKRMAERSVTADDFLNVLIWGQVQSVEKNQNTGHWKCEVSGHDIEGDRLTLQVAIDRVQNRVICVTVF